MLKELKTTADHMHPTYIAASPFPHIIIDNFLPSPIMDLVLKEVKQYPDWYSDNTAYAAGRQVNKFFTPSPDSYQFDNSMKNLKTLAPFTMHVLEYFHSKEVLEFLEKLTGITGLLADNDWLGGGLHKVKNGGKLSVHADFNIHWKLNLHRRINLLLYLNKDWKDEYNGELELWEKDLSKCAVKIKPIFNRAVIFNITDDAHHGHPIPLNLPDDAARYSIAMYYYSNDRPNHEKNPGHGVVWSGV